EAADEATLTNGPPAPYSAEAIQQLSIAMDTVSQPIPKPGASDAERLRAATDYFREVYKKAGYDFDASIIQLASDLKVEPGFLLRASETPAILTFKFAEQLHEAAKQKNIKLTSFCPEEVAVAIQSMVARTE
ncbi:MAG: hypothetical protein V3W31_02825, partial [Thermodesulfobacteriota bacterium]